ncbi:MAG: type II toxin-antitoxin system RelE/ParE family toxin [Proteobacteria bacterium]|nr:type II toxin-antitoxin system RelE/ParE family toxin [Pseudomonadota bacterium]
MTKFRLAQAAHRDMEDIRDYIAADSREAADAFIALLVEKFTLLTTQPEMGRHRPELQEGIRSLPIKKYIIYYRIKDNNIVEIVRVLSGYRDTNRVFH